MWVPANEISVDTIAGIVNVYPYTVAVAVSAIVVMGIIAITGKVK